MCSLPGGLGDSPGRCACGECDTGVKGFIVPCLLLLLRAKAAHGYQLMEDLHEQAFLGPVPDPGVVYRHLRRLEEEGMVCSRLEPGSGGPAKRMYSLTPEGEHYLRAWKTTINNLKLSLEGFLAAYEQQFPSAGGNRQPPPDGRE